MTYLVTGGAGLIGSHLVDRLLKDNHKIVILDDFSSGKEENISQHKNNPNLSVKKMSICDDLKELFVNENFDAVFHLAAIPRVQFSIKYPMETHEANVNGTLNLLNACKEFGVKRFIFSASSSAYGDQDTLPLSENMRPNPMSPYALHKLISEEYCKIFNFLYGLETIALRYFNVFGPRQNPDGEYACLIPKFITRIYNNERPIINGDGNQTRDFTFVEDVANANILAAKTQNKKCFGQCFNIGGGNNHSVNQVTDAILKISGKNIGPIHGPAVIEPHDTLADISKAKEYLDWEPQISFEEGLKKTWEYFTN